MAIQEQSTPTNEHKKILTAEEKRLKRNEQSKACRDRKKLRQSNSTSNLQSTSTNVSVKQQYSEEEKRKRRNEQSKACRLRKKGIIINIDNTIKEPVNTLSSITSITPIIENKPTMVIIEKPSSILVGRTNTSLEEESSQSMNDSDIPEFEMSSMDGMYEQEFFKKTGKDFNKFYKTYYPKLNWYIMRIVNSQDIAEDLVNMAFMQSLKKIDTYLPEYNYSTWLFSIAQKLAFTYLKDLKKMPTSSIDESDEEGNTLKQHLESTLEYTEPEDNTKVKMKYEYMMKQIEELPEKYRVIITLRELDGLTYKEIDDVLKIGEQNVKNRIHNGRILLQKKVEAYFKMLEETM